MSDQKLRELERRWRETGSVEDEAAYLCERVRVGDLTQERLELAAYCGHEGAELALGRPAGIGSEIRPGSAIGPFSLGLKEPDFQRMLSETLPVEVRMGLRVYSTPKLQFFFEATSQRLVQILARGRFGGRLLRLVGVGDTLATVSKQVGPIQETDEDELIVPTVPGVGFEAEGNAPSSRVTAIYVYPPDWGGTDGSGLYRPGSRGTL